MELAPGISRVTRVSHALNMLCAAHCKLDHQLTADDGCALELCSLLIEDTRLSHLGKLQTVCTNRILAGLYRQIMALYLRLQLVLPSNYQRCQ